MVKDDDADKRTKCSVLLETKIIEMGACANACACFTYYYRQHDIDVIVDKIWQNNACMDRKYSMRRLR